MLLLSRLAAVLVNHLPFVCHVCERWTQPSPLQHNGVCEACVAKHASPAHAPRLPTPQGLEACVAALAFEAPWSALIARYKFGPEPALARAFAALMRENPQIRALIESSDWVVPLPLAPERLAQRGFNQAHWLSKHLLARHGLHKLRPHLLKRVRETPSQRGLDVAQRHKNVTGAFALLPHHESLQGKRVLLVDDVVTTGATLQAAAKPMLAAGARVSAVALAHTPLEKDQGGPCA